MMDLFTRYELKGMTLKNRVVMPPMCQYAVDRQDGIPNDWHYIHYVSRAVGGTGLIIVEMTGIHPDGRITNKDLGIWSDGHIKAFRRITAGVQENGAKIAIQLGHAGRKALDAEPPVAPSAIPFDEHSRMPEALTKEKEDELLQWMFAGATRAYRHFADARREFADALYDDPLEEEEVDDYYPETYVRPEPKVGRNEPCPCRSGKKYKKCCGASEPGTAH